MTIATTLARKLTNKGHAVIIVTAQEYTGEHEAPDADSGAPLYDLSINDIFPADFYSTSSQYAHTPEDRECAALAISLLGKPWAAVTIYRAIPKSIKAARINAGDWVTLSKNYAKEHGEFHLGGKGQFKIITATVHARDVYTDGNSLSEWGYHPREETENERNELKKRQKDAAISKLERCARGELVTGLNKYEGEIYYGKPAEFFQDLIRVRNEAED